MTPASGSNWRPAIYDRNNPRKTFKYDTEEATNWQNNVDRAFAEQDAYFANETRERIAAVNERGRIQGEEASRIGDLILKGYLETYTNPDGTSARNPDGTLATRPTTRPGAGPQRPPNYKRGFNTPISAATIAQNTRDYASARGYKISPISQATIQRNVQDYVSRTQPARAIAPVAKPTGRYVQQQQFAKTAAKVTPRTTGYETDPVTGRRMGGYSPISGAFTNQQRDQLRMGGTANRALSMGIGTQNLAKGAIGTQNLASMGIGTQNLAKGAIGTKQLSEGAFATPRRGK
jgi:hypothetical protein